MKFRDRVRMAVLLLLGRVTVVSDQRNVRFKCNLRHAEGTHVVLEKKAHEALTRAADELKYARGFIAKVEDQKFGDVVKELQGK